MNLRELIKLVGLNDSNYVDWVNLEYYGDIFGIHHCIDQPDKDDIRITEHWLVRWLCTDTDVGIKAICFDGVLVGITYQHARKSDRHLELFTEDCAKQIRDYIFSLAISDVTEYVNCNLSLTDEVHTNKEALQKVIDKFS